MIFETSRLKIRQLTLDDFEPYFEMQSNPNVLKFTGSPPDTFEDCQKGLKEVIDFYKKENNKFWVWAVVRKTDEVLVGTGAIIIEENGDGEIGYRFLEKFWGNGYGKEVMNGLLDYGFKTMKLPAIFATVDVLNIASIKILEKSPLNFVKEEWSERYKSQDRWYRLKNPELPI